MHIINKNIPSTENCETQYIIINNNIPNTEPRGTLSGSILDICI